MRPIRGMKLSWDGAGRDSTAALPASALLTLTVRSVVGVQVEGYLPPLCLRISAACILELVLELILFICTALFSWPSAELVI